MADPYRDPELTCPACAKPLHTFRERLICDACDGIMLTLPDLAGAIFDMTSIEPTFEWAHEEPGQRACPHCKLAMTKCKLVIHLEQEVERPKPELDRCNLHGLWFDHEELAKVIEKVATKGYGGGIGRKAKMHDGPAKDGTWSAMFPKFGGRGGF